MDRQPKKHNAPGHGYTSQQGMKKTPSPLWLWLLQKMLLLIKFDEFPGNNNNLQPICICMPGKFPLMQ